jgi:Domain of unknown function (DUF4129)
MFAFQRVARAWFRASYVLCALSIVSMWAADSADLRKNADSISQSLGLQRDLPTNSQKPDPQTTHDSGSSIWFGEERADSLATRPSVFWGILQWALLGLGAVVLLAFLGDWLLHDWLLRSSIGVSGQISTPGAAAQILTVDQILADAEQHAAAGQYREALHRILIGALAILKTHTSVVRESLTSREILAAAKLEPDASGALRRLLGQVESVWFGQKPVSAADYTAALTNLRAFREAQWPAR